MKVVRHTVGFYYCNECCRKDPDMGPVHAIIYEHCVSEDRVTNRWLCEQCCPEQLKIQAVLSELP